MAGPRLSWAHRRFCATDGRAVAHSPCFPLGGCLSTFLSVMPPVTRLHLIGAFFLNGRAQVKLDAPTFLCLRRACGDLSFLLPLSVANYSPVRCCVNIYVHSLCRAAGVLESQESGGLRARRALSGAGDRPSSRCSVPATRWRLPLALLLRRGSG